jgi:hypothetical protein
MENEFKVIWREGDGEMPPKAKRIVDMARDELLLKSLNLSNDEANELKYKADKNSQSIISYVSGIAKQSVEAL